jgi:hypothetical protein
LSRRPRLTEGCSAESSEDWLSRRPRLTQGCRAENSGDWLQKRPRLTQGCSAESSGDWLWKRPRLTQGCSAESNGVVETGCQGGHIYDKGLLPLEWTPCGEGLEYFHRREPSHKRECKMRFQVLRDLYLIVTALETIRSTCTSKLQIHLVREGPSYKKQQISEDNFRESRRTIGRGSQMMA